MSGADEIRAEGERAIAAGVPKISCLIAGSPTYQRLNSNMTIDENLRDIERTVELGARSGVQVALGMAYGKKSEYYGPVYEALKTDGRKS